MISYYVGKFLNLIGCPAPVRESQYDSQALNAHVSVKSLELYTIVSVNGLDIYLDRLTGKIKGLGSSPREEYTLLVTQLPLAKRLHMRKRAA